MKKLILFCVVILVACVAFAEPASVNLTDSDVSNFAKNFSVLADKMEKVSEAAEADKVLASCGISGPDRIHKYEALGKGAAVVIGEAEIDAETAKMMKAAGMDPFAQFTSTLNSKDLQTIRKHAKEIVEANKKYENR